MCTKVQEEFDKKRKWEYQLQDFYKLWYWLNMIAEKMQWSNMIIKCNNWAWIEIYQMW